MDRYEILILTIPELTKDEESSLEDQLEKFINDHKGSIISFDRWGKYRLAYPVRNNDYGVYFLMRFDVDNSKDFLKELRNLFYIKFNEMVMRHIVTRLKKDQSLEYKKPPSLEDTPKKHIGMFEKGEMKPRSGRFYEKTPVETVSVSKKEISKEEKSEISPEVEKNPETVTEKVIVQETTHIVPEEPVEKSEVAPEKKPKTAEVSQEKTIETVTETVTETEEAK